MAIDFSKINLEVIDINTNTNPDIFINQSGITFSSKRKIASTCSKSSDVR